MTRKYCSLLREIRIHIYIVREIKITETFGTSCVQL